MVWLIQSLIDLGDQFTKYIVTVLFIQILSLIISRLLLLRIVIYVNSVKGILHVQILQLAT